MSSDSPTHQIAIIDQQRVFADALSYRLKGELDFEVIACADDAEEAVSRLVASPPDVVILDAELPLGASYDLAADLRRRCPSTKIVFLLRHVSDAALDQALRLRAEGIFTRSESLTQLVLGLRRIAAGEQVIADDIAPRLEFDANQASFRLRTEVASNGLTDRQLEILRHLARGDSVKAVAQKLFISPKSVDNQKFRIMTKIGVRDKVSLALYAIREGLIQP